MDILTNFFLRNQYFSKKTVFFFILLFFVTIESIVAQSAGFNSSFAVFSINGVNTYYCMPSNTSCGINGALNGAALGSFGSGNTLVLKGAEHNVYKCGGADLTGTTLNYRIYPTATPSGAYTQLAVGYSSGGNNGCGGQDQTWRDISQSINVLSGLTPGAYTIEIFSQAATTLGTQYLSNSSNNYKASFTVCSSITTQPATTQSVCQLATPTNITVVATGTGLTYQWYSNTSNSTSGGISVGSGSGGQTATYTPPSTTVGTTYYYCAIAGNCGTLTTTTSAVVVNALPIVNAITGTPSVCVGSTTTLASSTGGGVWSTSNAAIATVSGGVVTGVAAGSATISYAVTTSGCTTTVTKTVTVNPKPTVGIAKVNDNCQVSAGTITVTITGGTPNYTIAACGTTISPSPIVGQYITVADSPATVTTSGGSKTFSNLQGNADYKLTVTDANGCNGQ